MSALGQAVVEELLSAIERDADLRARMKKALGVEPAPEPKPEIIYMSITDWAAHVGIGRSKAFELAADPTFPIVLGGRARRVDVRAAESWMRERFAPANIRRSA